MTVHINRLIFLAPLGSIPRLGFGDIDGMGRGDGGFLGGIRSFDLWSCVTALVLYMSVSEGSGGKKCPVKENEGTVMMMLVCWHFEPNPGI
jgi:hypothetical protein